MNSIAPRIKTKSSPENEKWKSPLTNVFVFPASFTTAADLILSQFEPSEPDCLQIKSKIDGFCVVKRFEYQLKEAEA